MPKDQGLDFPPYFPLEWLSDTSRWSPDINYQVQHCCSEMAKRFVLREQHDMLSSMVCEVEKKRGATEVVPLYSPCADKRTRTVTAFATRS